MRNLMKKIQWVLLCVSFFGVSDSFARSIQEIEAEEDQESISSNAQKNALIEQANSITSCPNQGSRIALILHEEGNLLTSRGYNALFEEVNRRLSVKGLLTTPQAEIDQQIRQLRSQKQSVNQNSPNIKSAAAAAETKAYLEGKSAVEIVSLSTRVIQNLKNQAAKKVASINSGIEKRVAALKPVFALRAHVNARFGTNRVLGVRQVAVTMDFDVINTQGQIIGSYKINEGSYSNFDVDGTAMRLVQDNADAIVAGIYKSVCTN
jgi:hypothetical protein